MNPILSKAVSMGLFFLFIALSGIWLGRFVKPYPFAPFNLHKFIALGAVAFLTFTTYKSLQRDPLTSLQITAIAITTLCFILSIVTGGLLSIKKAMPVVVLRLHQITPIMTVLSTTASLYFLHVGS